MDYIYKNTKGFPSEPISYEEVLRLIEQREIAPDTMIRNSLMNGYSRANNHQALLPKLLKIYGNSAEPTKENLANPTSYVTTGERKLADLFALGVTGGGKRAPVVKRVMAGVFDIVVWLLLLGIMLMTAMQMNWDKAEVLDWKPMAGMFVPAEPGSPHGAVWDFYSKERQNYFIEDGKLWIGNIPTQTRTVFTLDQLRGIATRTTSLWLLAIAFCYLAMLTGSSQSLGMALFKLKLENASGGKAGFSDICLYIGLLLLLGWLYIPTAVFTNGAGLHSILSKTSVTRSR